MIYLKIKLDERTKPYKDTFKNKVHVFSADKDC